MKDWKWIDLPETGSTNDEARKYSAVAGGGKFVITAVRQNNGRGRRGRSWVGMEGNLFMSLGIEVPLAWPGQLIFIVTLALAQSILKLCHCRHWGKYCRGTGFARAILFGSQLA